jgi:hypothetical protein
MEEDKQKLLHSSFRDLQLENRSVSNLSIVTQSDPAINAETPISAGSEFFDCRSSIQQNTDNLSDSSLRLNANNLTLKAILVMN